MNPDVVQDIINRLNEGILHFQGWELTPFLLLKIIFYPIIVVLLSKWVRKWMLRLLKRYSHVELGMQNSLSTIAYYIVLSVGMVIALSASGLPFRDLSIFTGAIGLGVGLGMQDMMRNFVCGFIILISRTFRANDWISLDDLEGSVQTIGIYSTNIRTLNDAIIIIPNSSLLNNRLINWTFDKKIRRVRLSVGVGYNSDMNLVKQLLIDSAADSPDILPEPAPNAIMTGFGASSVNFDLQVWTSTLLQNPQQLQSNLYFKIWEACQKNKIELPFTQMDIRIRSNVKESVT